MVSWFVGWRNFSNLFFYIFRLPFLNLAFFQFLCQPFSLIMLFNYSVNLISIPSFFSYLASWEGHWFISSYHHSQLITGPQNLNLFIEKTGKPKQISPQSLKWANLRNSWFFKSAFWRGKRSLKQSHFWLHFNFSFQFLNSVTFLSSVAKLKKFWTKIEKLSGLKSRKNFVGSKII